MRIRTWECVLAVVLAVCGAQAGWAADWFVAPNPANLGGGDGTKEKPFHDPYLAFRVAAAGDVIHIAAGTYYGRYDRAAWVIDRPRLTVRGGYDRAFTKRAPWETPTVFAVYKGYEGPLENNLVTGNGDHTGLVLDGLVFDRAGRNKYSEKGGLQSLPPMDGPLASFSSPEVTIKNCVFANGTTGGVELAGEGSRFENNTVVNMVGTGMLMLRMAGGGTKAMTVKGNTFAFTHDPGDPPVGKGAENALGVRVESAAAITDNVFIACGNAGVSLGGRVQADRVAVDQNVFYMSPFDLVRKRSVGEPADIREKNLEELEDVGLKSAAGNVVLDAGITGLKAEWVDAWSRHMLASYATPPKEGVAKLRAAAGLPVLDKVPDAPDQKGGLGPVMSVAEAVGLRVTVKQGAHPVELPVEIGPVRAEAGGAYKRVEWAALAAGDPGLANQRVELEVGIGNEQNGAIPADGSPQTHVGFFLLHPRTDDAQVPVSLRRFSAAHRQFEEARKEQRAREVEDRYLVRGVFRTLPTGRVKATILVESIVPAPVKELVLPARPQGRDWFVKAGATGGDGSKEKPFRDPFQALEKAEGGDSIHIAGGDYFGRLRSGKWTVPVRHLSILGGYDETFASRDPWKNPTRLVLDGEEKAKRTHDGTFLKSGDDPSDGLIVDGLVFDGSTVNHYAKNKSLDLKASPLSPLVELRAGREPLVVRNCVFVNASGAAVMLRSPSGTFENNVVVNTSGWAVGITADGTGPWIIRHNTIMFAADPTQRAGTGMSSSLGTLLRISGRAAAAIEGNILAFGDNFGLRSTLPKTKVSLVGNVLAGNLYCDFTDAQYVWAHGPNFQRRVEVDADFAAARGNVLELPKMEVATEFADMVMGRLYGLPSRIPAERWKVLAEAVGAKSMPAGEPKAPPAADAKPAGGGRDGGGAGMSIDDLMADLVKMKEEAKASDKPAVESGPVLCPPMDFKRAIALVKEGGSGPGARRALLQVAFDGGSGVVRPAVQYVKLGAAELDAQRERLDKKPVELVVSELRSSPVVTLFPPETPRNDHVAFSVAPVGGESQTRLAIVIRRDTAASKVIDRANMRDRLLVRGTARITGSRAMSIVVDSVEVVN